MGPVVGSVYVEGGVLGILKWAGQTAYVEEEEGVAVDTCIETEKQPMISDLVDDLIYERVVGFSAASWGGVDRSILRSIEKGFNCILDLTNTR